jgi:hypothetical protein
MKFRRSIWIDRSPEEVFAFLRDKDSHAREPESPVELLQRTTPGAVRVGTRFLEIVRIMLFVRSRIESEITRVDPPWHLEERFSARRMCGYLAYHFVPEHGGTLLVQKETLRYRGCLALLEPVIQRMLLPRIEDRLRAIRDIVESDPRGKALPRESGGHYP